MSVNLDQLHSQIEVHLTEIERLLPPSYRLTLLARCTRPDLKDADILLTIDELPEVKKAIDKNIALIEEG